MANSRFLLRTNFFSLLRRRTFATEVAASAVPEMMNYSPLDLERADTAAEISQKAKKPWTELSKDDKIAIYRASFPYTVEQMTTEEPYVKKLTGGVSALLALSLVTFLFLKKYVSAEKPRSINAEWEKATVEKLKRQRANPITGVCSQ